MTKKQELQQDEFEQLIRDFVESRNNTGFHLLKTALVVLEASKKLSKRLWKKWLKDTRVKLKITQAKKLVAIAKACQNRGQLTDLLNKEGIEKTYCITRLSDIQKQDELAEKVIDIEFTVKEVKMAVAKVEKENKSPAQAVEEVQNKIISQKPKEPKKTVPLEEYQKLQKENEQLRVQLAEFQKKQPEKPAQKVAKIEKKRQEEPSSKLPLFAGQKETNLDFLN